MIHKTKDFFPGFLPALLLLFLLLSSASAGTEAMLETGDTVATKMKSLAAGAEVSFWTETADIRAIRMADSLPDQFVPSEANTVSADDSEYPVYIFFDNEGDAGILYFYTEGGRIVMNPESRFLFSFNTALTDLSGIADWDASRVVDMYGMFADAKSLPDALALRNWDTSSVTNMGHMFSGDVSLMFVDVSNWDTSQVTVMSGMFQVGDNYKGNGQLTEIIGLGNLDVSNVREMTSMFYGAGQMTYYDISGWDVSKVESMNHMFCDNFKLRTLDLSGWDVSSVKTMYCMFDDAAALKTIGDVSHWNTASLIDIGGWLNGANSFAGDNYGTLDLSGWDTSNLKAAGEMFRSTRIHTIDLSGWTFDSITNDQWEGAGRGIFYETGNSGETVRGLGEMFKNAFQLTTVYVSPSGLESFNAAVENGVNTQEMWTGTKVTGFTVK